MTSARSEHEKNVLSLWLSLRRLPALIVCTNPVISDVPCDQGCSQFGANIIMTKESAKDAFCEREYEHFGASPFNILDTIGAKVVEQYAQMIDELQQNSRLGLSKAQQDTVLIFCSSTKYSCCHVCSLSINGQCILMIY